MAEDDGNNNDNNNAGDEVVTDDVVQDDTVCRVYDSDDFFTILVQMLLGVVALMSLYIKRLQERPRRTFTTWFLDVSKQGLGAVYAHVLNMIIASIISQNIRGDSVLEDQCAWYGLSYIIDTTLGLVLAVIFLRMLDSVANDRDWVHLKHSGVYTGPSGWKSYGLQLLAWMVIQTLVKVVIYFFMWGFSDALAEFGGFLFKPLQSNIRFELVFVMILFPGVLNCVYFWIADSYLKAKKDAPGGAHETEMDESGKTQSLLDDIAEAELVKPGLVPDWSSLSKIKQEANDQPL